MRAIDLNCDMGEGFGAWSMGDDAAMLRIVTSANIACGFHAGDPHVMFATLAAAKANGVQSGAHPGFRDLSGFGRRAFAKVDPAEIERETLYQTGAIAALARAAGTAIRHVKPHGALGNLAQEDDALAEAIARAIKAFDPALIFLVMPGLAMERAAAKYGLKAAREIYADRAYADSGNLLPRGQHGAVIHDAQAAAARVLAMVEEGAVICASGKRIPCTFESVCVHGDTPGAVAMAQAIRARLEEAGYAIRPMAEIVLA
ncbi:5-oxoprolinase subunit PxpA [Bosea sp. 117]|uniref:LamB/YcsF family protein n=1 Tax=Bosea sp. 117 TaxID=1125973 RepID=UPI0004946B2B|nr:5-oxoprolinase subunit PxpA [Bosea sp. 117]